MRAACLVVLFAHVGLACMLVACDGAHGQRRQPAVAPRSFCGALLARNYETASRAAAFHLRTLGAIDLVRGAAALRAYTTSQWCIDRVEPDACFDTPDRLILEVRDPKHEPVLVLATLWVPRWTGAVSGPVVNLVDHTRGQQSCRQRDVDVIVD